jgi:hypothetical protein
MSQAVSSAPFFSLAPRMAGFETSEKSLAVVIYRYYAEHFDAEMSEKLRDQYIAQHTLEVLNNPNADPLSLQPQVGKIESGRDPSLRELVAKMYAKYFSPEETATLTEKYFKAWAETMGDNRRYAVIAGEGEAERVYLVAGHLKALEVETCLKQVAEATKGPLKVRIKVVEDILPVL